MTKPGPFTCHACIPHPWHHTPACLPPLQVGHASPRHTMVFATPPAVDQSAPEAGPSGQGGQGRALVAWAAEALARTEAEVSGWAHMHEIAHQASATRCLTAAVLAGSSYRNKEHPQCSTACIKHALITLPTLPAGPKAAAKPQHRLCVHTVIRPAATHASTHSAQPPQGQHHHTHTQSQQCQQCRPRSSRPPTRTSTRTRTSGHLTAGSLSTAAPQLSNKSRGRVSCGTGCPVNPRAR